MSKDSNDELEEILLKTRGMERRIGVVLGENTWQRADDEFYATSEEPVEQEIKEGA